MDRKQVQMPLFTDWFSFRLAHSRITRFLFIIAINMILCVGVDALTKLHVGAFMRTDFFFTYFCIKSSIGAQGEVGWL